MTKYLREWKQIKNTVDNGYFGTTPFFIPFVDEPQKLRQAQYLYLISLCADYMKNYDEADEFIKDSVSKNGENLFAIFFVQIADFCYSPNKEAWKLVQKAQYEVQNMRENVTTVISRDVCENDDIHPKTKDKLAERIAEVLVNT